MFLSPYFFSNKNHTKKSLHPCESFNAKLFVYSTLHIIISLWAICRKGSSDHASGVYTLSCTIDPRISTTPGQSTPGVHRLGRYCVHQARGAVKCWASRMKGELHPAKNCACESFVESPRFAQIFRVRTDKGGPQRSGTRAGFEAGKSRAGQYRERPGRSGRGQGRVGPYDGSLC